MRIQEISVLVVMLPALLRAQVLNGDEQFPLLNQIRWDMSRQTILNLCAAHGTNGRGNDMAVTFDARFFGADANAFVRFKNGAERPQLIDVKFKELTEKLLDTLVSHFTRVLGESPIRAEKEKSLLLITLRMEVAAWKTKTERITLVVGKKNKSIFDINLSIAPLAQ